MDDKSDPFYQAASGSYAERYSVTVLSEHSTTGGPKLQQRMDNLKAPGLARILKFYSKDLTGSVANQVFAEDYYISERPTAKMKVLISLPCGSLDSLPEHVPQPSGTPNATIDLNTYDLETKIKTASSFLGKYKAEIEEFYGRVYDIDFDVEITKLNSFLPALTNFLGENEIVYSSANSDLITLYINDSYKVLMTKVNQGQGYVDLIKGYQNFIENSSVNNDRTIFLLSKLDEIQKNSVTNKPISWSKFLNDYIYRPPTIDFSKPPPRSYVPDLRIYERLKKDKKTLIQTGIEVQSFRSYLDSPKVREELQKEMEAAHSFVGDTVLSNLDQLSSLIKDMESIYDNFFNKLGLDGLINSAVQCLDLPEIGVFSIPTEILDTLTEAAKTIQGVFNPPTMAFPGGFPVVDFMADMIVKMLLGVLESMISMLIQMVIEIIKSLFDFCNECAVETDANGNKKLSKLAFGQSSFGAVIGAALAGGLEANSGKLVLGSFYSSLQENSGGDVELLSQQVLKNQIKSRQRIYKLEAEEIYEKYQSGELAKPHRLALDKKVEETFGMQWTVERGNFLNLKGKKVQELFGSTDVTVDRIKVLLEREEPWDTEVFKSAAEQVAEYLEMSSTVLNPGEIGNALLGCNVGDEAKEVMRNTLPDFPDIYKILAGDTDEETDNNISALWNGFSNIIPQKAIIEQVTAAVAATPVKFQCLCDVDDTALREDLLKKKDPLMTPEQRREQVQKSKERKRNRLKEMAGMIGKDNILAGMIPPLVCSGSYDDNGNPVIVPGILPVSHPVTQFMVKQTLDTIYDPLHTTFTRDLKGMIPAMSQKPLVQREVPRTVIAEVDGEEIRTFGMEFLQMVNEGLVSYGSLPYGSKVPGSATPPEKWSDEEDQTDEEKGTDIRYNWFLDSLGFPLRPTSAPWDNPQGAGIWEEGQTKPTAEQEYEWEKQNVELSASRRGGFVTGIEKSGGRRLQDDTIRTELGKKWGGIDLSMADYAKTFGSSPIPVKKYSFGDLTYAPGLKDSYKNMCAGFGPKSNDTIGTDTFSIKDTSNSTNYSFKLPNIMNSFGVDFDEMSRGLAKVGGEILNFGGSNNSNTQVDSSVLQNITTQLAAVAASSFNFIYKVPDSTPTNDIQKDRFSLDFKIIPPAGIHASASAKLSQELLGPPEVIPINPQAQKVIDWKNLEVNEKSQPQEEYFYDFAKHSWLNGNTIYRNGEAVQRVSPELTPSSLKTGFLNPANSDSFIGFLEGEFAYKNLFGDLFCAFTSQIGESPYLNLQANEKGEGLLNLNLAPARIVGNDALCYRTLLDIDLIKRRVLEEYEYVKCFKQAFDPFSGDADTTGLTGNKDSAFEISSRAGCVLLTIRLYVVEYLLKSVYAFHYFVLGKGADVDATSVYYLYHQIVDGLSSRSIGTPYFREFQKETIELYNRNNKETPLYDENRNLRVDLHRRSDQRTKPVYEDFKEAIEYFIKNQLYSVSRRLSKQVHLKGDGSPHSILLEKWLPTVEPPKYEGQPRFAEQFDEGNGVITLRNKPLGTYMEVAGIPDISDEVQSSIKNGGTLTDKRISSIRGESGTGSFGDWGMLYQNAAGSFFREYFAPDLNIDAARRLLHKKGESPKPSQLKTNAARNARWLWPSSAGSGDLAWVKTGQPELRPQWAFREAITLGYQYPATTALEQPTGDPVTAPKARLSYANRMGNLGMSGFPFNEEADVTTNTAALGAMSIDLRPITSKRTILNGAFPFGVSQAEQDGMIGDGTTDIPGGLIRFIEAAKNWTLGPILYPNTTLGINTEAVQGRGAYTHAPRIIEPVDRGSASPQERIRGGIEYTIYKPENNPWWWGESQKPIESWLDRTRTKEINYLQSSKFYGPGSLLWAFSRERWVHEGISTGAGIAHGVAAFGIVNDILRDGIWPTEYKESYPSDAPGSTRDIFQWYRTGVSGVDSIGILHRLPFLIDWHNYVLGKPTHPDVKPGTPDWSTCSNCEITKNVEYNLRRVQEGIMPYISLMDLDVEIIIRTLEWEQIQYRNMISDMDMITEDMSSMPIEQLALEAWKTFSLRVLINGATVYAEKRSAIVNTWSLADNRKVFYDNRRDIATATVRDFINQPSSNRELYRDIVYKYGSWITEMKNIRDRFKEAEQQRDCMAQPAKDIIANGRAERNEMLVPPTLDVSNGNFILEPYIRVEDYDPSEVPGILPQINYVKNRFALKADVFNPQSAEDLDNNNMLKGVVNIDAWDEYMRKAFKDVTPTVANPKLPLPTVDQQSALEEDCGDGLPNRQEGFRESVVGATGTILPQKHQLRDFFKSLHFGLRVSYLASPDAWTYPEGNNLTNNEADFSAMDQTSESFVNASKEKTYHMTEELSERRPSQNRRSRARNIYLTPLTSVEVPIDMFTKISDMFPADGFPENDSVESVMAACGGPRVVPPDEPKLPIGYFRHIFGESKKNSSNNIIPLSSPRNALQKQLEQTDEYAFLFKYAFSMDRMLSLTNLYSATYLSSLPDINNLFAPSKENLMFIFLNSLRSGQWANACQTGNKELMDALLNGIDVPWAALLGMILKFPLKIFKAFMEQSDINIAISKNIQRAIKMLNSIIADSQRQANAIQAAGASALAAGERLAGTSLQKQDCGFGIHSPEATQKPPNDWFDPVDETFIYEPETWMIGLALLPATIFAPWLMGPPITLPHGIAYWVLDDSHINWLDADIDDWISNMQKNKDNLEDEIIDEPCEIDYELEFGLASEIGEQKMLNAPQGSTNDDDTNNNGNNGGSSY